MVSSSLSQIIYAQFKNFQNRPVFVNSADQCSGHVVVQKVAGSELNLPLIEKEAASIIEPVWSNSISYLDTTLPCSQTNNPLLSY